MASSATLENSSEAVAQGEGHLCMTPRLCSSILTNPSWQPWQNVKVTRAPDNRGPGCHLNHGPCTLSGPESYL